MSDILVVAEKLAAMLKGKGFEKQAAELESLAAYFPQRSPPGRQEPEEVVPGGGEFVGEGKIEVVNDLSGSDKLKVMSHGSLSPDQKRMLNRLTTAVGYYNQALPSDKKYWMDTIKEIEEYPYRTVTVPQYGKFTPQEQAEKFRASMHLASIQSKLSSMGYEALARRVGEDALRILEATIHDLHQIMSIEALYEKSVGPKEFDENIKKLAEMHRDASKIIEEFDREHISKVVNKKDMSLEEAVKETVKMVREADGRINDKVLEFERGMKLRK